MTSQTSYARAIAERQASTSERAEITAERTLFELAILAFSDLTHYRLDETYNLALTPDAPPTAMRAVCSVKQKVREHYFEGMLAESALFELPVLLDTLDFDEPL